MAELFPAGLPSVGSRQSRATVAHRRAHRRGRRNQRDHAKRTQGHATRRAGGRVIRDTLSVEAGDVRLAVYVSGPRDAPSIVLVHGYPDSAAVWEPVRAQLDARYRVISYDVRGAGASDAPGSRAAYRLERLAADLAAVADATCGARPFHLVGHDWGAIQSWEAVTDPAFKGRIASYTSISGPCLDHASLGLRGDGDASTEQHAARSTAKRPFGSGLRQTLKSWYIFFFHLPWLPELVWRAGG